MVLTPLLHAIRSYHNMSYYIILTCLLLGSNDIQNIELSLAGGGDELFVREQLELLDYWLVFLVERESEHFLLVEVVTAGGGSA